MRCGLSSLMTALNGRRAYCADTPGYAGSTGAPKSEMEPLAEPDFRFEFVSW